MHPYQYAYSNPVLYTDPSGQCIFGFDTIVCVVAGAAAIGAAVTYGVQVYHNYQQGLHGTAAWTTINGPALRRGATLGGQHGTMPALSGRHGVTQGTP